MATKQEAKSTYWSLPTLVLHALGTALVLFAVTSSGHATLLGGIALVVVFNGAIVITSKLRDS